MLVLALQLHLDGVDYSICLDILFFFLMFQEQTVTSYFFHLGPENVCYFFFPLPTCQLEPLLSLIQSYLQIYLLHKKKFTKPLPSG